MHCRTHANSELTKAIGFMFAAHDARNTKNAVNRGRDPRLRNRTDNGPANRTTVHAMMPDRTMPRKHSPSRNHSQRPTENQASSKRKYKVYDLTDRSVKRGNPEIIVFAHIHIAKKKIMHQLRIDTSTMISQVDELMYHLDRIPANSGQWICGPTGTVHTHILLK